MLKNWLMRANCFGIRKMEMIYWAKELECLWVEVRGEFQPVTTAGMQWYLYSSTYAFNWWYILK